MTTREEDLAKLEEDRDKSGYGAKHARLTLERVFRQSKDDTLERMRHALQEAHKRNNPREINRLEGLIHEYTRSRHF